MQNVPSYLSSQKHPESIPAIACTPPCAVEIPMMFEEQMLRCLVAEDPLSSNSLAPCQKELLYPRKIDRYKLCMCNRNKEKHTLVEYRFHQQK